MRLIIGLLIIILLPAMLSAEWIIIPQDYETIQEGIDEAEDNDTLIVFPGVYEENIDFDGKAILLLGLAATIDGGGEGPCVSFTSGEGLSSVLIGFTLTNGSNDGSGGGIEIVRSSPTLFLNTIKENSAESNGGGISMTGPCMLPAVLYRNLIIDNEAGGKGGAVYASRMTTVLLNNTIVGNSSDDEGGAFYADFGALMVQFTNNIVVHNESGDGGAISRVRFGASVTARYNDVWENEGGNYDIVQAGEGSISEDPEFIADTLYFLSGDSPCIDAGDPNLSDPDGTRSDIGALPSMQIPEYEQLTIEPEEVNFGEVEMGDDSTMTFVLSNPNEVEMKAILLLLRLDTPFSLNDTMLVVVEPEGETEIEVTFEPSLDDEEGERTDTLRITSLAQYELDFGFGNIIDTSFTVPLVVGTTGLPLTGTAVHPDVVKNESHPTQFELLNCYPNPFNASLNVAVELPISGDATLTVWDTHGRRISTLWNGHLPEGEHCFQWTPQELTTGSYFIRLELPDRTLERTVHYLK